MAHKYSRWNIAYVYFLLTLTFEFFSGPLRINTYNNRIADVLIFSADLSIVFPTKMGIGLGEEGKSRPLWKKWGENLISRLQEIH